MNFYRIALFLFVASNLTLFVLYMRATGIPWDAFMIFIGIVFANAPVVIAFLTAQWGDRTLKGHWLNWLNLFIPTVVGATGVLTYSQLAFDPRAHPASWIWTPLGSTAIWMVLLGLMILIYVFVRSR